MNLAALVFNISDWIFIAMTALGAVLFVVRVEIRVKNVERDLKLLTASVLKRATISEATDIQREREASEWRVSSTTQRSEDRIDVMAMLRKDYTDIRDRLDVMIAKISAVEGKIGR